jgi:hypothetical protein
MGNFEPDFYFHQTVKIVNPFVKLGHLVSAEKPAYDIQFFPEGGNLVAGLRNNLAFRVVGKNGKGIKFNGFLVNNKNDTVAKFNPFKFGIGQFPFTPLANQHYRAIIVDSTGQVNSQLVPDALDEGYVMLAADVADFVKIDIRSKFKDTLQRYQRIYLSVQARNAPVTTRQIEIINGRASFQIDKKTMLEGVNRLTLFDQNLNSVCTRSYFIRPKTKLRIWAQPEKSTYLTREKIAINLASAENNNPQQANLSVAVYRMDSLSLDDGMDIASYLWLTAELKGAIESPGYYLDPGTGVDQAVDNLMLTHGWSRFRWESKSVQLAPEYGGHLLSGRVLNNSGLPVKGINTYLSVSGKQGRVYLSQSDDQGFVHYDLQNFYGERKIVLQTNTEIDSTYRIELNDTFLENRITPEGPEFSLSEKLKKQLNDRSVAMQLQYAFTSSKQNENSLTFDSISFYGKPDEKYLLDEFTRFPTMEEVMREYVKGVMVRKRKDRFLFFTLDRTNSTLFKQDPLVLLDGVPVFNINKIMSYDPRKIQKLDVITRQYFLGHLAFNGVVSYTTYQGDLTDYVPEKSNILFVEGLQLKKEFFSPVYETKPQRESRIPDRRHLLYWAPEVQSDGQGQGKIEFYASDVPGDYCVVIQALSANGNPGRAVARFKVKNNGDR